MRSYEYMGEGGPGNMVKYLIILTILTLTGCTKDMYTPKYNVSGNLSFCTCESSGNFNFPIEGTTPLYNINEK